MIHKNLRRYHYKVTRVLFQLLGVYDQVCYKTDENLQRQRKKTKSSITSNVHQHERVIILALIVAVVVIIAIFTVVFFSLFLQAKRRPI